MVPGEERRWVYGLKGIAEKETISVKDCRNWFSEPVSPSVSE